MSQYHHSPDLFAPGALLRPPVLVTLSPDAVKAHGTGDGGCQGRDVNCITEHPVDVACPIMTWHDIIYRLLKYPFQPVLEVFDH